LEREIALHNLGVIDLSTVINGQHTSKKPKLMNQAPDISLEALAPIGPIASPAASQMSNMANPKIKINTRGRKSKGLKVFISFCNYHSGHTIVCTPLESFREHKRYFGLLKVINWTVVLFIM
jgi:hypothetical protein